MNPQLRERLNKILGRIPLHIVIVVLCVLWILPTLGLLITSFRPVQDVNLSGWWTVLSKRSGNVAYDTYCASCHGVWGDAIPEADLSDPEFISQYRRSVQLSVTFDNEYDGKIHLPEDQRPTPDELATILTALREVSQGEQRPVFWLRNYIDVLAGYRGRLNYVDDCEQGNLIPGQRTCDFLYDATVSQAAMGRAFINTAIVAIPSTMLPIFFAAFAAFAFSWLEFKGRQVLFAILVGLQIVPLQMALIPVFRLYVDIGLTGTFLGVWLFHTGFGLPYAIYLTRNFLGSLPREIFESVYLDGASPWTAFFKLAVPLSVPAIASLGIFQLLWVWNDLLVALVFLGGTKPVMTYQISNMVTSLGAGWHLLTAAAFVSFIVPMVIFFSFQRYFIRGLLGGAIKG
ncbi:MAG: carbohydrate ABC transporter permease [Chloroflexota bacterium]